MTAGGYGRVATLPNVISFARLCCVPLFVVLVAGGRSHGWWPAAVLLGVLGATDWVDGFLARRLGQVTTVGKVLDPLADRLLLVTAALTVIAVGAVPTVVAALAVVREVVVAGGFLLVAALGGRRMDVSLSGKATTFCLMAALPLYLAGHSTISWHRAAEAAGWAFAVPALVLGWVSVAAYVGPARRAVKESRAAGPEATAVR